MIKVNFNGINFSVVEILKDSLFREHILIISASECKYLNERFRETIKEDKIGNIIIEGKAFEAQYLRVTKGNITGRIRMKLIKEIKND